MYKLVILSLLVFCIPVLSAQEARPSKVEVFGGYSLLHFPANSIQKFNGWNGSVTTYLNSSVGLTADFAGSYRTVSSPLQERQHIHTFMFGPHFAYHKSRYQPFAHSLFGFTHDDDNFSFPDCAPPTCLTNVPLNSHTNSFSMAAGGGVDLWISSHVGIRPLELDYVLRRNNLGGPNNLSQLRYSGGVIFSFGKK